MRFLLDECLSARMVQMLAGAGHDALHARDLDLLGRVDSAVLAAARRARRVLVSADTDFGALLTRTGARAPSVILFRQVARGPERQAAILLGNLDAVASDLDAGAIVVFTDDRIRIRRLPIRQPTALTPPG